MSKEKILIESGEKRIVSVASDSQLLMVGLDTEIAMIIYNRSNDKVAIGRGLDSGQMREMFEELTDHSLEEAPEGSLEVQLIGGNVLPLKQEAAEQVLAHILSVFQGVGASIRIVAQDVLQGRDGYDSVSYTPSENRLEPYNIMAKYSGGGMVRGMGFS